MDQCGWGGIQREGKRHAPDWREARLRQIKPRPLLGQRRGNGQLHGEGQRGRGGGRAGSGDAQTGRADYREALGADAELMEFLL